MIGILSDDDDLYLVEGRQVECVENQRTGRIDHPSGTLFFVQLPHQLLEVRLFEFGREHALPAFFNLDVHDNYALAKTKARTSSMVLT